MKATGFPPTCTSACSPSSGAAASAAAPVSGSTSRAAWSRHTAGPSSVEQAPAGGALFRFVLPAASPDFAPDRRGHPRLAARRTRPPNRRLRERPRPMSAPNKSYDPVQVAPLEPPRSSGRATRRSPRSRPRRTSTRSSRRGSPTPATARRWRWPTARSARCRRPPRPRPASGSARPAAAVTSALEERQRELEAERDARVLVEEAVDVTLPWDRQPRRAPATR